MAHGWRLARYSDPEVRTWGDECIVHHALSNDTFRLTGDAGQLLVQFAQSCRDATPGIAEDSGDPGAQSILEALVDLGLVERC